MFLRSTVAALAATAVLAVFSVSASDAADRGHSAAQDVMDETVQRTRVPGILGQAEDGGGVWNGAAGVADRVTQRPRLAGDRFRIGSLTKPFIAVVMLQLEAAGTLDLDETVEHWLPGVVRGNGNDGAHITLRQLLRHTSGLADFTAEPAVRKSYFSRQFLRTRYDSHRPRELARAAMRRPPLAAPGTAWHYSNTNYVLAGMVIEKVTGNSYREEVQRRIVRPLGLTDTSLPGTSPAVPGRNGRAYSTLFATRPHAPVFDVTALNPSLAGASGEMVSSTGDLIRFFRALLSGQLLRHTQLHEMMSTVPTGEGATRYGLGLTGRTLSCGATVWGHDGSVHGSRSVAVTTADGAHTAAFNINADWAGDTSRLVEAEYCG